MPTEATKRRLAVFAGVLGGLASLGLGLVLQNAVGVIYATATPGFLVQFTISFFFLSVLIGEFLSRAVTKGDRTAWAFAGFGVTLFVGLSIAVLAASGLAGILPTFVGIATVAAIVAAVYSEVLVLRGRKAEIYHLFRVASLLFIAAEAGLGYALPLIGVRNPNAALGGSLALGVIGSLLSREMGGSKDERLRNEYRRLDHQREYLVGRAGVLTVRLSDKPDDYEAKVELRQIEASLKGLELELSRTWAALKLEGPSPPAS